MRCQKLAIFSVSLLFSSLVHADIFFYTLSKDNCQNLPGTWNGTGSVSALGGIVHCKYTGVALVTPSSDPYSFSMHVDLNKVSGICPQKESLNLSGRCDNGVITLKTDAANLSGNLNEIGT